MKFINLVNPVNPVKKIIRQGFTIIELLVAMSLLVILLGLSGLVFNTTVAAHRAAGATIDVSRNLRAVTEQLNADFRGLRKDAPLTIWFERDPATGLRYDQIQFFADGDFQSTKQYDTNGDIVPDTTVYGNVARVYYGHAWEVDSSKLMPEFLKKGYRRFLPPTDVMDREPSHILSRRVHISTNNTTLDNFPIDPTTNQFSALFSPILNNYCEYDNYAALVLWKQLLTSQANCDLYLNTCLSNAYNLTNNPAFMQSVGRPIVSMTNIDFLHNLLAQGVVQMQVQWAYTADDLVLPGLFTGIRWWPSVDPDGNVNVVDSDFDTMGMNLGQFGVYMTMPAGTTNSDWFPIQSCRTNGVTFKSTFYPKALKFTFTLKDSNGIFVNGKTFTHIVYLDN